MAEIVIPSAVEQAISRVLVTDLGMGPVLPTADEVADTVNGRQYTFQDNPKQPVAIVKFKIPSAAHPWLTIYVSHLIWQGQTQPIYVVQSDDIRDDLKSAYRKLVKKDTDIVLCKPSCKR